jgi:hypothetical protein
MNHLVLALQAASAFGRPDRVAIGFFAGFITLTLGITYWAARRTSTTEHFYAAGPFRDGGAERVRARRRLHERGIISWHRRSGFDEWF